MKKSLKSLLLVSAVVLSLGVTDVNAAAFKKGQAFSKSQAREYTSNLSYSYNGNSEQYKNHQYTYTSNGVGHTGYCLDPHKKEAQNYTIDRILGQGSKGKTLAYDMGLLEIVKNGYNQYNTSGGDNNYIATNIAVRAYTELFGYGGAAGLQGWGYGYASSHVSLAARWASYRSGDVNDATGYNCKDEACYKNKMKSLYGWYIKDATFNFNGEGEKILNTAQALFFKGVEKAGEVARSGKASEVSAKLEVKNAEEYERDESTVKEYIYADFTVEGFDKEKGYVGGVSVDCPQCSANGITLQGFEYYDPQTSGWTKLDPVFNLLNTLEEKDGIKSGKIRIRMLITKRAGDEECKPTGFTINYKYSNGDNNGDNEYQGAILKYNGSQSWQRMLVITKLTDGNGGNNGDTVTPNFANGVIDCDNKKEACPTEVQIPICSDKEDEAIAKITAPKDIKKCILDNVDDANNSYMLSKANGGLEENDFCSIFCKEDYNEIKLNPVVENVVCGGYFQLTSHIEGKKDCYSGGTAGKESVNGEKSIDKEKYLNEMKRIVSEMQVNTNSRNEAEAMLEVLETTKELAPQEFTCTCKGTESIDLNGVEFPNSGKVKYTTYRLLFNANDSEEGRVYDKKEDNFASQGEIWDTAICAVTNCCTGNEKEGKPCTGKAHPTITEKWKEKWEKEKEKWQEQFDEAVKNLEDLGEEYVKTISDYNGCMTAWDNNYKFDQRIKYYYNEYHYTEEYTPYYDLLEKADNEDLFYLEAVKDEEGNVITEQKGEIKVCYGETSNEYECNDATYDIKIDENDVDGFNYNSSYGDAFKELTYVKCNTAGNCDEEQRQISKASFVKKTVEKKQDYITPTAFYQIEANGKITVNSGYAGDKVQLDAIINSLPVSTSTTGGGVFKLLIEDLGEFYDLDEAGNIGRLLDFQGDHEERSVAAAQKRKGVKTFDGEYICNYESPCRPKECPDCSFVCEGDDCKWVDDGCPNCNIECINCIFNLDELQLNFKTISSTNFNSAGREFGYNWITSSSYESLKLLNDKAQLTIKEIEDANETIYNEADKTADGSTLDFSIKMTPEIISKVKDYNKNVEDDEVGGYANDSLTCYPATIGGKTYNNIYCYSELIDELVDNYGDSITVKNRLGKDNNRESGTDSSGYWTLWDNYVRNESVLGGPSWK